MKAALLIVLSLSALAFAGPTFNKNNNNNNQIDALKAQQQQYMTGDIKSTQAVEILKQWCFASQMSQNELTASFKKLVGVVESSPEDEATEAAVMSERICHSNLVQKSSGDQKNTETDVKAHELIKDVYMDALISCQSRQCVQQLTKIISSNKVDSIRASYYMTRIAVTETESIKDESEIKSLAESFISQQQQSQSEAVERQKLFAVTALLGKSLKNNQKSGQHQEELKQVAEQVVKTIVERYIKPVSQQEVAQYVQQPQQQSQQVAKKIAKRSAAIKAIANIPGYILKEVAGLEETLIELVQNKQELLTTRQSAIECLEQIDTQIKMLKQLTFDQQEPIEIRVAAYRALIASTSTSTMKGEQQDKQNKQQLASDIVNQIVKHCENQGNQQQDDQFVLYAVSHLDNLRTSQQPEHEILREVIAENKQHYMQIQVLCKKLKQKLQDVRKSSRNYRFEQEFNQIESGLVLEGDMIYESKHFQGQQQQQILPKMVRVNMSIPVMGKTVNVVEVTIRQDNMDEELLGALKLASSAKFNSESVSQVVSSFKSGIEQQQQRNNQYGNNKQQTAEADLSIKVDGCTIVYLCVDDFKSSSSMNQHEQKRNTRSVYTGKSLVDELLEQLKRNPIAFNRGFNFNLNERLAKVLDVDANIIAGLRFDSRASGRSDDFEIVANVEPRFAVEAIVGPAKMSSKKLLQRASTKTALGLRLRYKNNELVDVQIDLPLNTMEIFTIESQLVEKKTNSVYPHSYTYLPESIYGQEDIYSPDEEFVRYSKGQLLANADEDYQQSSRGMRKMKRSIFEKKSGKSSLVALMSGKQRSFGYSLETPEKVARATGLRGKLRVVASPKDMSFIAQAVCQKYEPQMQGYRVQVQKIQRGSEQKQYVVSISTPGSRLDRTMQVRFVEQANSQRTLVKADVQSPLMNGAVQLELVHDGRQYAIKVEASSTRGQQWRHVAECGLIRGSQSQTGRIATTYKPYLTIDSSALKRPIQMQGVVSYQQSPKTVITYELKCPTSGDFVQGKFILDSRTATTSSYKQLRSVSRRSMKSPIELAIENDITFTGELISQVGKHAVKVHKMLDWNPSKLSVATDLTVSHKNLRKSTESQWSSNMKVDPEQQTFTVQRRCPQEANKEFRITVNSDCKSYTGHQLVAECRYDRNQEVVVYKHKINWNQVSSKKVAVAYELELVASELRLNEKLQGRTMVAFERKHKQISTDLSSRSGKSVKLNVDFVDFSEHEIQLMLKSQRYQHITSVKCDSTKFQLESKTEKQSELKNKIKVECEKQTGELELVFELPTERVRFVADLKPVSGKLSSLALQTPRFASKAEFSFESLARKQLGSMWTRPFKATNYRFKSDLSDTLNKESYWMESNWNADRQAKSFLRFDSPVYRSEFEFDPREETSSLGMFRRAKRSISNYQQLYNNQYESPLSFRAPLEAGKLGDKLWMIRSVVSSPSKLTELKQKARRALFEYADREQSHKHQLDYNPIEERVNFDLLRQQSQSVKPMRFIGDLSTNWRSQQQQRPSTISMNSDLFELDMETKPFDGEEAYARLNAVSRHRRSPFSKHESEIRYKKNQGFKGTLKHEDQKQNRHAWQMEADESPKKWAKMTYESDKHGKKEYEHQWRKHVTKRNSHHQDDNKSYKQQAADEDVYANKISFGSRSNDGSSTHRSQLDWYEPTRMVSGRNRRDTLDQQRRYNTIDYLKHVNARLNSQTMKDNSELYKLDFDYQPISKRAQLEVSMPNEMLHSSSFEFEPTERLYKIQSRLVNRRTNEPSYELIANTKPILGLATAEQEPIFFDDQHEMLERPIGNHLASRLFKQPLKLDYTDKYGRQARLDYDHSPMMQQVDRYAGLRQKRAAVYFKDDSADFEHSSTYDFYPEALIGGFKQGSKRVSGDFVVKAETKFGPVVLHADSTDKAVELKLQSPIMNGKLTAETSATKSGAQLIKVQLDNKQQQVQLTKIVRKTPVLRECEIAKKIAKTFDESHFEHQTELLVSLVEEIFKVKSQTMNKGQLEMVIEGELNKQQEKMIVKVDGKRVKGQMVVDFINKSTNLVLDVDDKRTLQHQTRIYRISDKYYGLESMTSYKQQPIYKVNGKISSMIFTEPEHLFFGGNRFSGKTGEHISFFEASIFEPKQYQVSAKYDCLKKEGQIVFVNVDEKRTQKTQFVYDDRTQSIIVQARLDSDREQIYSTQSKINLTSVFQPYKCRSVQSCQSEIVYSGKSDSWVAKILPGKYVSISRPTGQQIFNLSY